MGNRSCIAFFRYDPYHGLIQLVWDFIHIYGIARPHVAQYKLPCSSANTRNPRLPHQLPLQLAHGGILSSPTAQPQLPRYHKLGDRIPDPIPRLGFLLHAGRPATLGSLDSLSGLQLNHRRPSPPVRLPSPPESLAAPEPDLSLLLFRFLFLLTGSTTSRVNAGSQPIRIQRASPGAAQPGPAAQQPRSPARGQQRLGPRSAAQRQPSSSGPAHWRSPLPSAQLGPIQQPNRVGPLGPVQIPAGPSGPTQLRPAQSSSDRPGPTRPTDL
ncbi:hypothetical protein CRG98_044793 [Punica granatum]|uniref:Uncharacterized protein n=1 Tax=Punica granatum TaxID=22663 RepID=A0A2I0HSY7_PUNGR|nr:hypothetical protein CRG98_044793 [Punica granatum]